MLLAEIVAELGQRAFVGKVNMNMNCPDSYRETLETSLRHTREFIQAVLDMKVRVGGVDYYADAINTSQHNTESTCDASHHTAVRSHMHRRPPHRPRCHCRGVRCAHTGM